MLSIGTASSVYRLYRSHLYRKGATCTVPKVATWTTLRSAVPATVTGHYTALGTWHTPGTTHCSRRTFLLAVPPLHQHHRTGPSHSSLVTHHALSALSLAHTHAGPHSRLASLSTLRRLTTQPVLLLRLLLSRPPPSAPFRLSASHFPLSLGLLPFNSALPFSAPWFLPFTARPLSIPPASQTLLLHLHLPLPLHLPQSTPWLSFQPARLLRPRLSTFHRVSINLALWHIETTRALKLSILPPAAASTHFAHPPHRQPALAALSCSSRRPSGSCSRSTAQPRPLRHSPDSFVHRPTHGRAPPGLAAQLSINSSPSQHMSSLPS